MCGVMLRSVSYAVFSVIADALSRWRAGLNWPREGMTVK